MDRLGMMEWGSLAAALAAGVWLWREARRRPGDRRLRACGLAMLAVLVAVGSMLSWRRALRVEARATHLATLPREGRPGGYVSSQTCRSCHPEEHASWHRSFHRTMTQLASPQTVLGNFDNVTLQLEGETYRLERRGDEFWAEMPDLEWKWARQRAAGQDTNAPATAPRVRRRIGMLTGSHHMQAYWISASAGNQQYLFPFTWLNEDRRWAPRDAVFLLDPEHPRQVQTWNSTCLQCHVTAGQTRQHPENPDLLDSRAAELGIACEACHGPGERHVALNTEPARRGERREAGGSDDTLVNPARLAHDRASQVCGQCHSVKHIPYAGEWYYEGFRYRPGEDLHATTPVIRPLVHAETNWMAEIRRLMPTFVEDRYWSDGMVRVSGREYNGLVESPCHQRGKLSCLSCHSPHRSQPEDQLKEGMASNQGCLQCHARIDPAAHSRHRADSSGSQCYNCHMPHTTYGLLKAIRSHQIDSPSVTASLETGRPNACNLCHLDRTLEWTATNLTAWFGSAPVAVSEEHRVTSAAALWALRGDAGQRALIAHAMGWDAAHAASGTEWLAPYLAELMEDPYAAVRYIAHRSLRRLAGFTNFTFDYVGPEAERADARLKVLRQWELTATNTPVRAASTVLLERPGRRAQEAWLRLKSGRDNRSIYLQE